MTKRLTALAALALALCLVLGGCRRSEDTQAFWRTNFMGVWEFSGGSYGGKEMTDQQVSKLKDLGMNGFLVMNERGTCRMNIHGVALGNGTWVALDVHEAELTFTFVEEEEEEEEGQDGEKSSSKLISSEEEEPKEKKKSKKKEQAEPETRVVRIAHHEDEDRLCLEVGETTEIWFAPATQAGMNEYLDLKGESDVSKRYENGFAALDTFMAMTW